MAGLTDKTGQTRKTPHKGARQSRPFDWTTAFGWMGTLPNSDNIPASLYRQMSETDETISAGLEFIELTCLAHLGDYQNPNKRARDYIRDMWAYSHTPFQQAVSEILSALRYGFSVMELVTRPNGSLIWLDELPGIKAETIHFIAETDPAKQNYGRITGIKQTTDLSKQISREDLAIYSHRGYNSNPYGNSRLKSIYKNWVLKNALLKNWGVALEAYGSPIALGKTANASQMENADGVGETRSQQLLSQLSNLQGGSALVVDNEDTVELVQAKISIGNDFERAQNHLNKCMLRGLLIPALLFEPTDIGSFALGSKHFELFLRSIGRLLLDVKRVLLDQVYRPLLWANFGTNCPVGDFVTQKLEEEDLKLWSEIFFAMTQSGYLSARRLEDLNTVRSKFNVDTVTELLPEAPKAPSDSQGDNGQVSGEVAGGTEGTNTGRPQATPQRPSGPQGRAAAGAPTSKLSVSDQNGYLEGYQHA